MNSYEPFLQSASRHRTFFGLLLCHAFCGKDPTFNVYFVPNLTLPLSKIRYVACVPPHVYRVSCLQLFIIGQALDLLLAFLLHLLSGLYYSGDYQRGVYSHPHRSEVLSISTAVVRNGQDRRLSWGF